MAIRNNPFKPLIKKIPVPFRNSYFLVLMIFFGWMIFFDKHDILTQWKLQQALNRLEQDKAYYDVKIQEQLEDKRDIEQNKEKFAREHYFMQKKDEDVFIFVEEDK